MVQDDHDDAMVVQSIDQPIGCEYTHMKWPSFQNIHRKLAAGHTFGSVIATEKLNGSNLGIEVCIHQGLVALHGRNMAIWSICGPEDPFDRTYGHLATDTFHSLKPAMEKLQVLARDILKQHGKDGGNPPQQESVVFFGEWYQPTAEPARWHPFGYGIRAGRTDGKDKFVTMTLDLHQTFSKAGLEPPKLLFAEAGTISEVVNSLFPVMMNPPYRHFEGVLINDAHTSKLESVAKWKVASFEEQPLWILGEQGVSPPNDTIDKLYQVFHAETTPLAKKVREKKPDKKPDIKSDRNVTLVELALSSVLSKSAVPMVDMRQMSHADKVLQCQQLQKDVLEDLEEQYREVGKPNVPKSVQRVVVRVVSRKIFASPG